MVEGDLPRLFSILFSDEFKLVPSKDARLTTPQHEEICDYAQAQVRRLIGSILFSLRSHSFSRAKANSGSFFELVGFFRAPLFRKVLLSLDVEGVGSPKMRKSATIADTSPLAVEAVTVLQ